MEVREATSAHDIEKAAEVLLELRPSFELAALISAIESQGESGYRLAILESTGVILAVAGFRIDTKLAWGKHLYVDDLVTTSGRRSEGAGQVMVDWLKACAEKNGCAQLHLDSGVQNFQAHRFYLREGSRIASHHFSIVHK